MAENVQMIERGGKTIYLVARPVGKNPDGDLIFEAALHGGSFIRPRGTLKYLLGSNWGVLRYGDVAQAEEAARLAFPEPRPEPALAESQAAREAKLARAARLYEDERSAHARALLEGEARQHEFVRPYHV